MIEDIFKILPSKEGLEHDMSLAEAESHNIRPCGDEHEGKPIFKLLTREKQMITYHQEGKILRYQRTENLH